MAYDAELATRIRARLGERQDIAEKKMFGGVAFLINGNMCCGVWRNDLILRLGPEAAAEYLGHPDVKDFDPAGKPMTGWALVKPTGFPDDDSLADWLDLAVTFAGSLSPKQASKKKAPTRPRRKRG